MGLIQRIKTLWKLSESKTLSRESIESLNSEHHQLIPEVSQKPQMAQIIKRNRKDPIEEVLEYPDESKRSDPLL